MDSEPTPADDTSPSKGDAKLSWAETYRETAASKEVWSDLEATNSDGLDKEAATLY